MTNLQRERLIRPVGLLCGSAILLGVALFSEAGLTQKPTKQLKYNKDVRPILAENCFACHGPDSAARKAGLRLDKAAEATAVRNGAAPIVKGKPDQSEIVRRMLGKGPLMPPESSHKKLTPAQIETIRQWIAQGAEYEQHWSYIAPKRPSIPVVKDAKWVRNPIDRFVLARLEAAGLKPAPEADRRTLARRLSLDLTGLPPSPEMVDVFVSDKSADYYEKYVERLMATPQWGEHRGRYWLDAARYADTHGIHFDNYREMWSYRDWVVKALNKNMRFDQFTIEQLAGDLLPGASLDQLVATGFNRCNITTNEGGAISEEYNVLYARDRTETASLVWMASTTGCAVCHDHKFDPVTQKDFYSLAAFFNNTTQNAMDGNIKDTPPIVTVPLDEDMPRWEQVTREIVPAKKAVEERKTAAKPDFDNWFKTGDRTVVAKSVPTEGLQFHAPLSEGSGKETTATLNGAPLKATASSAPGWSNGYVSEKAFQRKGGSVVEFASAGDFEKDQPVTYAAWIKLPKGNSNGAVLARMDESAQHRGWDIWIENNRVATHIINRWPEDALKVVAQGNLTADKWHHVAVTYDGGGKAASVRIYIDGLSRGLDTASDSLKSTIRTSTPFKIGQRSVGAAIEGVSVQDFRFYTKAISASDAAELAKATRASYLVSRGNDKLSAPEQSELFTWWLNSADPVFRDLASKLAMLENEERGIKARGTVAHVSNERKDEAMAYVLYRGEYDKRRDPVKPNTPASLPPMPQDFPKNRLGLAKWLLLPEHPLTTRVTVNRFWQEIFGQGLVRTAGDFGISGELPSHPELLDWMAVEFREGGWDMKKFFKMLVTSATYRQASIITPEKRAKDLANRLYSRGPRFRMDAEMIRDYALAASGLLVKKLGGPSVRPYQPEGVWEAVAMIGSNTRDYRADKGESLYRRSMYTFWKRAAPPASMDIFNAPNRETCAVRRERTNTPLQALVTLNDVQFIEAARALGEKTLKEGGATPIARIDYVAKRVLGRTFRVDEKPVVLKSLKELELHYKANEKEAKQLIAVGESKADANLSAAELAAWTMVVNQILNLDEALCK